MVIDSAFLGGVFRNFVDLIKWRTLMLMLFLGRELGRHTCGGRRPQASAIRPPSCTGLVLDTFFFRLRGKGRGTHLGDPTQHRSNSGAGARISSKFFFSLFFRSEVDTFDFPRRRNTYSEFSPYLTVKGASERGHVRIFEVF